MTHTQPTSTYCSTKTRKRSKWKNVYGANGARMSVGAASRVIDKTDCYPPLFPCQWTYYSMGQLLFAGDAATDCACFLSALEVTKIMQTCRRGHAWGRGSILWRQLFLQNMVGGKSSFIDCGTDWRREYKDDFCWMTGRVVVEDCIPKTGIDSDLTDMVTSIVQLHQDRYFCGGHDGRVVEFDKNRYEDAESVRLNNVLLSNEWIRSMTSVREDTLAVCVGNDLLYVRVEQAEALSAEMFSTLKGHTGPVHFVAPYNDTMCVSTSFDRTARLWDLSQGVCTGVFRGHTEQLYGVMCSAPYVVTASYDRSVRLFDNRDQHKEAQCIFQGHNGPAWFVQPCTELDLLDLTRFYSSSSDGIVREWDLRSSRRPSHIFPSMSCSSCNDFMVDHGHKRLVCGYDDGSVSVFSTAGAKERIHHDQMSARYIRKVGSFQSSARPRHKYFFGDSNGRISLVGSTENEMDLPKPLTFQEACVTDELSGIRSMLCCEQENTVFYGTYDGHVKRLTVAHGGMQKS